jgi:hypothetical protein
VSSSTEAADAETRRREEIGNGRSAVEPRVGGVAGHQAVPVMHRHQKILASAEVQREVLETLCGGGRRAWEETERVSVS